MRLLDKLALTVPEVAQLLSIKPAMARDLLREGAFGDPGTMKTRGDRGEYRVPTAAVVAYSQRLGAAPAVPAEESV